MVRLRPIPEDLWRRLAALDARFDVTLVEAPTLARGVDAAEREAAREADPPGGR